MLSLLYNNQVLSKGYKEGKKWRKNKTKQNKRNPREIERSTVYRHQANEILLKERLYRKRKPEENVNGKIDLN